MNKARRHGYGSWHRSFACIVWGCGSLLWACGGSTSQQEVKAAPKEDVTAQAQAQAQERFSKISEALDKLGKEDTFDAVQLELDLEEILRLDPTHIAARFNLAVLKERLGEKEAALALYEDVRRRDANFIPAAENVAAFYVDAGNVEQAVKVFRAVLKRDPLNITSRLALARILAERGEYEEAIQLAREALQRKADAIEAFRVLARSYHALGNVPMAELIIGRGLKIDKDDVELHQLTATILLDRDKLSEAVNRLKQVVAMAPDRLLVRAQLAEIALQYRDFGGAAQQFDAILKQLPNHREARIGLAVSYKGLGRHDEARKLYTALLADNAKDIDALWNLGVLLHRHLNQYDEAIEAFQKYRKVAGKDDEKANTVDTLVAEITREKSDIAAQKEREEKERKRLAALEAACSAVAEGRPPDAEAIGGEQDRIEVAWQLLLMGRDFVDAGDFPKADHHAACAFGVLPKTQRVDLEACAPMYVFWTQELYRMDRIADAVASTEAALKCDPENPDAQLIRQQLAEIQAAQAAAQEGQ